MPGQLLEQGPRARDIRVLAADETEELSITCGPTVPPTGHSIIAAPFF